MNCYQMSHGAVPPESAFEQLLKIVQPWQGPPQFEILYVQVTAEPKMSGDFRRNRLIERVG